jgi:hypothetical protein
MKETFENAKMRSRNCLALFEDLPKAKRCQFRGFQRCKVLLAPERQRDREYDVVFHDPFGRNSSMTALWCFLKAAGLSPGSSPSVA